jgi:hypothetical protein
VLFILGGLGHFQALRGKPSVVVRLAHLRGSPIPICCNAEKSPMFPMANQRHWNQPPFYGVPNAGNGLVLNLKP